MSEDEAGEAQLESAPDSAAAFSLVIAAVVVLALAFLAFSWTRRPSLEGFVESVKKPGDRVLASVEQKGGYLVAFDTGDDQIAVFVMSTARGKPGAIFIKDSSGKEVFDSTRPLQTLPKVDLVGKRFRERSGLIEPIIKTTNGELEVSYHSGPTAYVILRARFPWRGSQAK